MTWRSIPDLSDGSSALSPALLGELLLELGQKSEEVAHEAVVGDLEYRRLLVLVDGDDHLGVLHAGEMLDGAGNSDRDVEVGRHHLARLTDLPVVRGVARVDRGA